jgi:hypothetical protein
MHLNPAKHIFLLTEGLFELAGLPAVRYVCKKANAYEHKSYYPTKRDEIVSNSCIYATNSLYLHVIAI